MTIQLEGFNLFLLVFVRMAGLILLNPLLSRRNVPVMTRMGLVLALTVLIVPALPTGGTDALGTVGMVFAIVRELAIGMAVGYVFQLFYYMLFFVGDSLDVEFGMSMAKVFDPGTNLQMSISSNLLVVVFFLYFFATNGHLQMLYLFSQTYTAIPVGGAIVSPALAEFGIELFIELFALTFRLILPFMAAEFALQLAMGVLMKLVPQIHVFVINFQLKQGLGLIMLLLLAPLIGNFIDRYLVLMLENMQTAIMLLAG